MKKILLCFLVCLAAFQSTAWATDFCAKLKGTHWKGSYITDAGSYAHCVYNQNFNFAANGKVTVTAHKDKNKTSGWFSGRCPAYSHAVEHYLCKNNRFTYTSNNGKGDRIDGVLSASRLYNSGGSYHHTVTVNYTLDLRKQS